MGHSMTSALATVAVGVAIVALLVLVTEAVVVENL